MYKYYEYYDSRNILFGNTVYRIKDKKDLAEFFIDGSGWYTASWWKDIPKDELVEIEREEVFLKFV